MNPRRADPNTLLRFGVVGAVVTALCCFTPALVVLLGVLGLSALTGYLDLVLLPLLAGMIALIVYALRRKRLEGLVATRRADQRKRGSKNDSDRNEDIRHDLPVLRDEY